MLFFEDDVNYVQDREDLLALLKMRFGEIPPKIVESIYAIEEYDTLERLIIVASNVPTLQLFIEELEAGSGSFKILGERFNPIEKGGGSSEKH